MNSALHVSQMPVELQQCFSDKLIHVYLCFSVCLCTYVYVCDYRVEKSTDQVIKPVNMEALGRWAEFVPVDVRYEIHKIAPMLDRLGYDADAYPPTYGQADSLVTNNTRLVKMNEEYWQRKAQDIFQQATKVASTPMSERHHKNAGLLAKKIR